MFDSLRVVCRHLANALFARTLRLFWFILYCYFMDDLRNLWTPACSVLRESLGRSMLVAKTYCSALQPLIFSFNPHRNLHQAATDCRRRLCTPVSQQSSRAAQVSAVFGREVRRLWNRTVKFCHHHAASNWLFLLPQSQPTGWSLEDSILLYTT